MRSLRRPFDHFDGFDHLDKLGAGKLTTSGLRASKLRVKASERDRAENSKQRTVNRGI